MPNRLDAKEVQRKWKRQCLIQNTPSMVNSHPSAQFSPVTLRASYLNKSLDFKLDTKKNSGSLILRLSVFHQRRTLALHLHWSHGRVFSSFNSHHTDRKTISLWTSSPFQRFCSSSQIRLT